MKPQVIYWPSFISGIAQIAPLQAVGADHVVKIRSNLPFMPNVPANNSGIFKYPSMIRTVALASLSNLSAINFTITGLASLPDANGNPLNCLQVISETIAGPNIDTVESINLYSRIDSIVASTDTAGDEVSVGFGSKGIIAYIFLNLNSPPPQHWAIQGQPITALPAFTYEFYGTLTEPEVINDQQGNVAPFPAFIPAFSVNGPHNNQPSYAAILGPSNVGLLRMVWTKIDDSAGDGNASFYQTFIQQGIAG